MSLALLRQRIADIAPPPAVEVDALPSGIAPLDRALPDGGVPRGRLTELLGPRGSGKTTLARRVVAGARAKGLWVAWIDATRTLAPRDWTHVASGGFWVVRPPDRSRAAWCADVLIRSGAFGLVVIDGAPALTRAVAVRLIRLARDADCALVAIGDDRGGGASLIPGALRLSLRRRRRAKRERADRWTIPGLHPAPGADPSPPPAVISVTVEKGGGRRTVEVSCVVGVARRLCTHPEVPDRRGVAPRRPGTGGRAAGAVVAPGPGVAAGASAHVDLDRRTLPRKRRCAEPNLEVRGSGIRSRAGAGC